MTPTTRPPRVSILIPTSDRPEHVCNAVDAALRQGDDVEVIVKDGGTSIADRLPLEHPRLTYLHGPDESIAHAVNQAAEVARGDVFHFACDDDVMQPGSAPSAVAALAEGYEWTYGKMMVVRSPIIEKDLVDRHGDRVPRSKLHYVGENGGGPWNPILLLRANFVPQPSTFYTRRAWERCGPYDETLPLCFDYEMVGRLGSRWEPTVRAHVDSFYLQWPGSISVHSQHKQMIEVAEIQRRWREWGFGRRAGE